MNPYKQFEDYCKPRYKVGDKVIFTELDFFHFQIKRQLYCRVMSINGNNIRIVQLNGREIETNVFNKHLREANLLEILCNELLR